MLKSSKTYLLRAVHCNALGQIKHSSGKAPDGKEFSEPLNWAHFAGESNTIGYSIGLTSMIFMFSVIMSSFDIQCGQA
jgi:hypothetical protein